MNKLYRKLAFTNIRNSKELYLPYTIAGIFTVIMFYTMSALADNKGLDKINGSGNLITILSLGLYVLAIFSVIFIFYTNSFIIKRRKKEIGIYNILGMEKRHIAKVLLVETLFHMVVTIVAGLFTGILFNKLMILILYRITGLNKTIEFVVSVKGVKDTIILFAAIYLATYLYNLFQVKLAKPIDLLRGGNVGEREPKTKVLMALAGFICIGIGYGISITTKDPLAALYLFFVAVVFVIIGTYNVFMAGSIWILKLLRKNKKFYYKTKNFTAVSGMIYRMRQNAKGLANICILSTMVLVVVSTTVSMYLGIDDELKTRYTSEIYINAKMNQPEEDTGALLERAKGIIKESGRKITSLASYYNYTFIGHMEGNKFSVSEGEEYAYNYNELTMLNFVTADGYEMVTGKKIKELPQGMVAFVGDTKIQGDEIFIGEKGYKIDSYCSEIGEDQEYMANIMEGVYYVVVSDMEMLKEIYELGKNTDFNYDIRIDIDGTETEKLECNKKLIPITDTQGNNSYKEIYIETRQSQKEEFYALYGGLFFIGIFLGIMFLMITVLIIFYKQMSEGYEDRERFEIMEKVGMSHSEVKQSIQTQVRIVFFLPLITACFHVAASFPIVKKLLAMLNLTNTTLFVYCLLGTIFVFAVIYFIVFKITSAKYYRILTVSKMK